MFLLYAVGGHRYQSELWEWRPTGDLMILEMTEAEVDRIEELMARYQNVPMSLADASLIAVAESRRFTTLFTLDSDFYIYRLKDKTTITVLP